MAEKKQVPLRLNEKLYNQIAAWAERKKDGKYVSEHLDEPPELDIK